MNHHLPVREATGPAVPLASPSSPLLWVPPDEVRQAWASFGAEALSAPALLATSGAFAALSWETSALEHHRMAYHAYQRGFPQAAAARWLEQVGLDLDEAVRNWRCALLWLERLTAQSDRRQACTDPVEQVPVLSRQAVAQQQRLRHLLGQVQYEQGACAGDGQAPAPAAGAQEEEQEEEGMPWPSA